jgi:hypothetical protein
MVQPGQFHVTGNSRSRSIAEASVISAGIKLIGAVNPREKLRLTIVVRRRPRISHGGQGEPP